MTPSRLVALLLSCLLTLSLLPWLATASAAAADGEEVRHQVLDDFEGSSVYGTPYDTGNSATSSTVRASDPAVAAITIGANDDQVAFGGKSLRLSYDFSQAPALNQISVHGGSTRWGSSANASGLGMWIYGDASGDTVHVNERPNGGGSVATAPVTIDWTGWRYVEFRFATVNASTWHQIYSPLVIKAAAGERGPRTLVVDQLTLLYAGEAGAAPSTSPVTTPVTVRAWSAADAAAVALTDVAPARGSADHPTTPVVSATATGPVATGSAVMSIDGTTVPAAVTGGTISHQVTEPLAPGKHRVRVSYRSPVVAHGTQGLVAGTDWTFTVGAAAKVVPAVLPTGVAPELAFPGDTVSATYRVQDAANAGRIALAFDVDPAVLRFTGATAAKGQLTTDLAASSLQVAGLRAAGLTNTDTLVTATFRALDEAALGDTTIGATGTVWTADEPTVAEPLAAIAGQDVEVAEKPAQPIVFWDDMSTGTNGTQRVTQNNGSTAFKLGMQTDARQYELYLYVGAFAIDRSSITVETDPEFTLFGDKSLKLHYDLRNNPDGSQPYVSIRSTNDTIDPRATKIGYWYFHDGNNVRTKAWIASEYSSPNLNRAEKGWQYVEIDLRQIPASVKKPYNLEHLIEMGAFTPTSGLVGTTYIDSIVEVFDDSHWTDRTAPVVTIDSPAVDGVVETAQAEVRATVTDAGTGVSWDTLQVFVDGTPIDAASVEVDEASGAVVATSPVLAQGSHKVVVKVQDNAEWAPGLGNPAVRAARFVTDSIPTKIRATTPATVSAGDELEITYALTRADAADELAFTGAFDADDLVVTDVTVADGLGTATVDADAGTFDVRLEGLAGSGHTDGAAAVTVHAVVDRFATGPIEVVHRDASVTLAGDASATAIVVDPSSTELTSAYGVEATTAFDGMPVTLTVTDGSGDPVEGASLRIRETGEVVPRTAADGTLTTDALTRTMDAKTIVLTTEDGRSTPATRVTVMPVAANTVPASLVQTINGDPRSTRALTWVTHPQVTDTVVEYVTRARHTASGFSTATRVTGTSLRHETDFDLRSIHKITLTGLAPGTEYVYRAGDGTHWSQPASIRTEADEEQPFTFLNLADNQSNEYAKHSMYGTTLNAAVAKFPEARFVLQNGDIVENGNRIREWDATFGPESTHHASLPTFSVVGNHEMHGGDIGLGNFLTHYQFPKNGPSGLGESVYSFDYGNVHVAALNTESSSINSSQLEWLRQDMNASDKPWKFVVMHRGPYGSHYNLTDLRNTVTPVFDELGIDMVFQGHDHVYIRSFPMKGGAATPGGTVYLTSDASGDGLVDPVARPWIEVLDDGTEEAMFSGVRVDGDMVTVNAWYADTHRAGADLSKPFDTFTLKKDIEGEPEVPTDGVAPTEIAMAYGPEGSGPVSLRHSWVTTPDITGTVVQYATRASYEATGRLAQRKEGRWNRVDINVDTSKPINAHEVELEGLQPDTEYAYRVGDGAGNVSEVRYVRTRAADVDSFDFHWYTDAQMNDLEGYQETMAPSMARAFGEVPDPAFMLFTGDQVNNTYKSEQWEGFFQTLDQYAASTPVHFALGNHEYEGNPNDGYLSWESPDPFVENYTARTNAPRNGPAYTGAADGGPTATGDTARLLRETSYWFEYGDALFLVLNNFDQLPDEALQPQLDWMRSVVKGSDAKWKIAAFHHGPYLGRRNHPSNYRQVAQAFDQAGIDLSISGHDGMYLRTNPLKGDVVVPAGEGTTYITGAAIGDGQGYTWNPDIAGRYTAVYRDNQEASYQTVSVSGEKITVRSVSRNPANGEYRENDLYEITRALTPDLDGWTAPDSPEPEHVTGYPPLVDGWHEISTAEQLRYVSTHLGEGFDELPRDARLKLVADIDLGGKRGFTPIGLLGSDGGSGFTGEIDGNGHTVSGLVLDHDAAWEGDGPVPVGFVSTLGDGSGAGVVRDLGLVGVTYRGARSTTGALVGTLDGGTVAGSFATGRITDAAGPVGGLVGTVVQGSVTDSYATVNVSTSASDQAVAGGLVGVVDSGDLTNVLGSGAVTSTGVAGGLVGRITGAADVAGAVAVNRTLTGTSYGSLVGDAAEAASITDSLVWDAVPATGTAVEQRGTTTLGEAAFSETATWTGIGWDLAGPWAWQAATATVAAHPNLAGLAGQVSPLPFTSRTELRTLLGTVTGEGAPQQAGHTAYSWAAFDAARSEALERLDDPTASQESIDAAVAGLRRGIDYLNPVRAEKQFQARTADELRFRIEEIGEMDADLWLAGDIALTGGPVAFDGGDITLRADEPVVLRADGNVTFGVVGATLTVTDGIEVQQPADNTSTGSFILLQDGSTLRVVDAKVTSALRMSGSRGVITIDGSRGTVLLDGATVSGVGARTLYAYNDGPVWTLHDSVVSNTSTALYRGEYVLSGTTTITGSMGGGHVLHDFRNASVSGATSQTATGADVTLTKSGTGPAVADTGYTIAYGFAPAGSPAVVPSTGYTAPVAVPRSGTVYAVLTHGAFRGPVVEVPVTVEPKASEVSGLAETVVWGQGGSVAVAVTPRTATGTVEVRDGGTLLGSGELVDGVATIALAARALPVGEHDLALAYSGDELLQASTGTVRSVVTRAATQVAVTAAATEVVRDSGTVRLDVAVTAPAAVVPDGTVSAWLDGRQLASASLAEGRASLVVGPFTTSGAKEIEVRYSGAATTTSSSSRTTVTVTDPVVTTPPPAALTATTVEATAETQVAGRPGRVRVLVSPHGSGTVSLHLDGTLVAQAEHTSGATHVVVPAKALPVGRHTLVVTYGGSATHMAAQGTVTLEVVKQEPRLVLRAPKKVAPGRAVELTARLKAVGEVGRGKVRFVLTRAGRAKVQRVVTVRLEDDEATASLRLRMQGRWKVKAVYLGDADTSRATARANLRVG